MSLEQFLREPYRHRANSQDYWLATDSFDLWKKDKNNLYSSRDVVYKFNNYGFRCDNFAESQNFPYRVLFAGCSYTEGIGLPLEQTWAKLLHNKICKELSTNIPFWSIAAAASGTDHVLRYLHYFNKMLQPQIIICLLPYLERRERWMGDYFNAIAPETKEYRKNNQILLSEDYVVYQTEKNLVAIDLILEQIESHMLLIPIDREFNIRYMNLKRIEQLDIDVEILRSRRDLARDNMHPGPKCNLEFADQMFKLYWKKIEEKINVNRIQHI